MKALAIHEPYASMIASGVKTIETRTWKTRYRGPLLITVTKRSKTDTAGMAIAIVNLTECRLMNTDEQYELEFK